MQFSEYSEGIPEWLRPHLKMICSYCGSYIADNADESADGIITVRKCANPRCPGHMQHRLTHLAEYYQVKGVGPKTALQLIRDYRLESHLDILPVWFPNEKPTEQLSKIVDLACIEGYGSTKAESSMNSYKSFKDYFCNCTNIDQDAWFHRDELYKAETYFNVAEPMSRCIMYVMLHGTFTGYAKRDMFLRDVNSIFGSVIQVVDAKKRKTGVSYLIRETGAPYGDKDRVAREAGIPIVTPLQFLDIMTGKAHT